MKFETHEQIIRKVESTQVIHRVSHIAYISNHSRIATRSDQRGFVPATALHIAEISKLGLATITIMLYSFLLVFLIPIGLPFGVFAGLFDWVWLGFWRAGNGVRQLDGWARGECGTRDETWSSYLTSTTGLAVKGQRWKIRQQRVSCRYG
jgi:hypothetical protein